MTTEGWFETMPAALALGCSISSMRRYRDSHGGFLVAGLHYRPGGPSRNSKIYWNVPLIRKEFLRRSQIESKARRDLVQKAEQILQEA